MTSMKIQKSLTDEAILAEIGQRIARHRLKLQLTQAALAKEAGIGKRTLERVEAGATTQLSTIIRIFRTLDLLPALDQVLPEARPGPIEILARKGKMRQRAVSPKRASTQQQPWSWDDEP